MLNMAQPVTLRKIQWIIWILVLLIHVLSIMAFDPFYQALVYGVLNVSTYVLIIYGNALLLLPRFYEKGQLVRYVLLALILIGLVAFFRYYSSFFVYNHFFAEKPTPFRWSGIGSSLITCFLVYLTSILFYITLRFFQLKRRQEQLERQQAEAELNLLKSQVQPHFLFNTLNNIYFVAQRESPATAALLEKLSLILRYFVDEAPKEKIALSAELDFINSYIDLEKMRMRYPLVVNIHQKTDRESVAVPPMLLIPLVENVFKHGIDKRRNDNFINLSLLVHEERLEVRVENLLLPELGRSDTSGTGLRNLRSRLTLLYGTSYTLQAGAAGNQFVAQLSIPL
jgi:sensor histidine kinase YesM